MNAPTPLEIEEFIEAHASTHRDHGWVMDGRRLNCGCGIPIGSLELVGYDWL